MSMNQTFDKRDSRFDEAMEDQVDRRVPPEEMLAAELHGRLEQARENIEGHRAQEAQHRSEASHWENVANACAAGLKQLEAAVKPQVAMPSMGEGPTF